MSKLTSLQDQILKSCSSLRGTLQERLLHSGQNESQAEQLRKLGRNVLTMNQYDSPYKGIKIVERTAIDRLRELEFMAEIKDSDTDGYRRKKMTTAWLSNVNGMSAKLGELIYIGKMSEALKEKADLLPVTDTTLLPRMRAHAVLGKDIADLWDKFLSSQPTSVHSLSEPTAVNATRQEMFKPYQSILDPEYFGPRTGRTTSNEVILAAKLWLAKGEILLNAAAEFTEYQNDLSVLDKIVGQWEGESPLDDVLRDIRSDLEISKALWSDCDSLRAWQVLNLERRKDVSRSCETAPQKGSNLSTNPSKIVAPTKSSSFEMTQPAADRYRLSLLLEILTNVRRRASVEAEATARRSHSSHLRN